MAEHHRAQVRVGILAIAIGVFGIVVLVVAAAAGYGFEEGLDVGRERRLRFIDEYGAGGMHRPQRQQAFLYARAAHEGHHRVCQIDQLDTLAGVDLDGFGHHGETARAHRRRFRNRRLPDGDHRALAHSDPFYRFQWVPEVPRVPKALFCWVFGSAHMELSRTVPLDPLKPLERLEPWSSIKRTDAYPDRMGIWVQSPHGPATVSEEPSPGITTVGNNGKVGWRRRSASQETSCSGFSPFDPP